MKKLITLLALSATFVACKSTESTSPAQNAIAAVYKIDQDVLATSKTTSELVTKLSSINIENCPPEFKTAFKTFINSWGDFAAIEKLMYEQDMSKATKDIQAFISSFAKTPSEATIKLKEKWPSLAPQIDAASERISKAMASYISLGNKYNVIFEQGASLFNL